MTRTMEEALRLRRAAHTDPEIETLAAELASAAALAPRVGVSLQAIFDHLEISIDAPAHSRHLSAGRN